VLRLLQHEHLTFAPTTSPERAQVCRLALRALEGGWRRGSGRAGLRRALRSGVEFGERRPTVAAELRRLHADLARELDELGDRFD
jgi:hypothetical protein